jgi:hypothetical protein
LLLDALERRPNANRQQNHSFTDIAQPVRAEPERRWNDAFA